MEVPVELKNVFMVDMDMFINYKKLINENEKKVKNLELHIEEGVKLFGLKHTLEQIYELENLNFSLIEMRKELELIYTVLN